MKQGSTIIVITVFILLLVTCCNNPAANEPPQPCISGPWFEGSGGYGDYLESELGNPLSVSASCSSDADLDTLTARWDWNSDGNWDTYYISIDVTVSYKYPDTGWYELILSVDDGIESKFKSTMVHIK